MLNGKTKRCSIFLQVNVNQILYGVWMVYYGHCILFSIHSQLYLMNIYFQIIFCLFVATWFFRRSTWLGGFTVMVQQLSGNFTCFIQLIACGRGGRNQGGFFERGRCFFCLDFHWFVLELAESAFSLNITWSPHTETQKDLGLNAAPLLTSHVISEPQLLQLWNGNGTLCVRGWLRERWTRCCVHEPCPGKILLWDVACWLHHKNLIPHISLGD